VCSRHQSVTLFSPVIEPFSAILQEADVIHRQLEPFQTVVYGYDKLRKFEFARRPYHLHLRAARVTIVTADEIARLRDGAGLPRLRAETAVRILREAYAQYAVTVTATAPQVITNSAVIAVPDYQTIIRTAAMRANWQRLLLPLVLEIRRMR